MSGDSANLAQFLLSGKDPKRPALLCIGQQYTYGELHRRVEQIARAILGIGGRKGGRILLIGENSFFWVSSYLGILRAGLVCVPLSQALYSGDLEYIVRTTEPAAIFADREIATPIMGGSAHVRRVSDREVDALAAEANGSLPAMDRNDLAALMFTSGSTGRPRGVMVSHGNIIANTESIVDCLRLSGNDRILNVLPFHYCFGTSLLHTHLRVGGSLVIENRFMYPETVLQRMIDTECTGFAGVPSHFQLLLRKSTLSQRSFPHLRYVQQAGGHLPPEAVRELCAALPNVQVFIMYGQTEATARLSYLPPDCLAAKIGSVGKGIPGVTLRVVNGAGEEVHPGEVGEIVARGANVAQGYWNDPEESSLSFRDGELWTGDLATVDSDGFIYVVGRAKDFIKCGGERVSCHRIEEELMAFDELAEVAVIGTSDEVLGEVPKAFVVPHAQQQDHRLPERLAAFLKTRLPSQLIPRRIVVLQNLPKNNAGKVLKTKLKGLDRV